tara:strand:+ start:29343 stop:30212 length:870 start_codon:yes stop_codon:yes gene_type:complete
MPKTRNNKKKNKRKTRKIKSSCAPKKKEDVLEFSCYSKKDLIRMRNLWNMRHPDVKIKTTNPKKIWKKLSEYFSDTCSKEMCWIESNIFKNKINKDKIFAPKSPDTWKKNKNEWLTSIDILKFMKQYEDIYKCFQFLGPSPIDYDTHILNGECVWEDLCEFNLKEAIKEKKKKIGVIFNLDPHYKSGSHWVCLFININKKQIFYFDSYGDRAPTQIRKFARKVQNQSAKLGKKFKYIQNKKRHQYQESECGMYCLYTIIQLLMDKNISMFNKRIPDKKMENLRSKYFNI